MKWVIFIDSFIAMNCCKSSDSSMVFVLPDRNPLENTLSVDKKFALTTLHYMFLKLERWTASLEVTTIKREHWKKNLSTGYTEKRLCCLH